MANTTINNKSYYELMEEMVHADPYEQGKLEDTYVDERPYYLATVYSKHPEGLEAAYQDACKMTMFMQENGWHVFCPIVHSHGPSSYITNKDLKNSHEFWLDIDFRFVRQSKGLIICMMTNWKNSYGIGKEIELAKEIGKPIIYTNFMELPSVSA